MALEMTMTYDEWDEAFAACAEANLKVRSRSGKEYWIHRDQMEMIKAGGLAYGVPVIRHPRLKRKLVWLQPEHLMPAGGTLDSKVPRI